MQQPLSNGLKQYCQLVLVPMMVVRSSCSAVGGQLGQCEQVQLDGVLATGVTTSRRRRQATRET